MTPWFALYVTNERKAAEGLAEAGFEVFAPTYQQLIVRRRQKLLRTVPLLPGYVFARIPEDDFAAANAIEQVVCILKADGRYREVPEMEIAKVVRLLESGRLDDRLPATKSRPRGIRRRGLDSLVAWFEITGEKMKEAA
jgi:Transcription termination factor nusG